jgi:uncharacterized protein
MRIFSVLLISAIAAYTIAFSVIFFARDAILYHPNLQYLTPAMMRNLPFAPEEARIKTSDGETIIGWYIPAKADKPTILFFPGNAGHLPWLLDRYQNAHAEGLGILAVAYRGYSGSTGVPSEEGLHRDAQAAHDWLKARVKPDDIIIHGVALGGTVATKLASESPARLLVLEATYPAAIDASIRRFFFLPVRWMFKDEFQARDWIGKVKMPIFFVHGEADVVVPLADGRALFDLAPEPKTFKVVERAQHGNLTEFGLYKMILEASQSPRLQAIN